MGFEDSRPHVQLLETVREAVRNRKKILIGGNGGSATQADHFACELVGDGYLCIPLTNPAMITALANDRGYERSLLRQVWAYGDDGDVLILLTTSGRSENILKCIWTAGFIGMSVFVIGGPCVKDGATNVVIAGDGTQEIQENTLKCLHWLWRNIDEDR